ncbi:putative tryptophan transport protein [Neobacillus rhizosphaerae]|uniref:Tryptophan transport protein n=1 Tax=Neobacillus rhizosphaerae TaxID=2880965 RepID=A0ABM9ELS5_9BACI|nr:tryptophan transporter [Neobacillus rhizosphaerae]CAH2713555.1 putative tryptophan transport protein [Neobacillus rhizosphaerae]
MNTKNLVILSLLVGIGVVLHTVMPAFLTIKPDMMLAMMFLGIILIPEIKSVMLLAIVTGVLSGLTTGFPGGTIPNIIDKPVTALIFFGLFLTLKKYINPIVCAGVLTAVGTLVSGSVFLIAAYFLVGLPGPFAALFAAGVLPAIALNTVIMVILYPIAQSIFKRTKFTSPSVIQK